MGQTTYNAEKIDCAILDIVRYFTRMLLAPKLTEAEKLNEKQVQFQKTREYAQIFDIATQERQYIIGAEIIEWVEVMEGARLR